MLALTMEENMQHFWHIMLYYLKKGKNATETQKMMCAQCMEKAQWLIERVKKWFVKFLDLTDILAKEFCAAGLSYALEDV